MTTGGAVAAAWCSANVAALWVGIMWHVVTDVGVPVSVQLLDLRKQQYLTVAEKRHMIDTWLGQGRTDAWIAHQLEVPAATIEQLHGR